MSTLQKVKDGLLDPYVNPLQIALLMKELTAEENKELADWLKDEKDRLQVKQITDVLQGVQSQSDSEKEINLLKHISDTVDTMVNISMLVRKRSVFSGELDENIEHAKEALNHLKQIEESFKKHFDSNNS